ncbi:molybdopterin-dependent oxidoreductase [Eggerthellaceae bacterium zg-1084]|nr:molybdopterin-dependent oxidoreductase [Berryella wangjianweii]
MRIEQTEKRKRASGRTSSRIGRERDATRASGEPEASSRGRSASQAQSEPAASRIPAGVSRRSFVQAAGGLGALAGVAGLASCAPRDARAPKASGAAGADPFEGAAEFFAACPPECQHHNLKAQVVDGKVVRVTCGAANESRPCMMGMSRVEWLSTDQRLTTPLKRAGEKGAGSWEPISWDEALDLVADKLRDAIDRVGNAGIVCDSHAGNFNAIAGAVGPAFIARIGGATTLTGSLCCAAVAGATIPMFGKRFYDTRNTIADAECILVWGNNPAVTMNGYFGRFEQAMERGAAMYVIDPVHSETASKATEWVPIKPTTDTALALGMLKVIVSENLHDQGFLKAHSTAPCLVGADGALELIDPSDKGSYAVIDARTGQRVRHDAEGVDPLLSAGEANRTDGGRTVFDLIVQACDEWSPAAVEAETGVPAATVERLARAFASTKRGMIIQNMGGFMRTSYGTYAVAAQNNLAVFTGNIGAAGNGVCDAGGINNHVKLSPLFDNPAVSPDLPKIPRVQFARRVLEDDPNPIEVFISSRESPMTQFPNTGLVKEALKKIPFVVVIDSLMTSTALYADLVLPSATVFETEDLLCNARSHLVQLSQKAVDPPGEAHDDLWIFTQLAKRMGVGADFDHDAEFFARKALEGTGIAYEQLAEEHAIDAYPPDFVPYAGGAFPTASGKAELYQAPWLKKGLEAVPSYHRAAETRGGTAGLDDAYPLAAVQRKLNRSVHSTFGILSSICSATRDHACVMINSQDAAERGIGDGDRAVVYNDRGEHRARAIVTDQIMSGVVCVENGWWEQQGGSSSYVTNDAVGHLSGEHCCNETLVNVRKEA